MNVDRINKSAQVILFLSVFSSFLLLVLNKLWILTLNKLNITLYRLIWHNPIDPTGNIFRNFRVAMRTKYKKYRQKRYLCGGVSVECLCMLHTHFILLTTFSRNEANTRQQNKRGPLSKKRSPLYRKMSMKLVGWGEEDCTLTFDGHVSHIQVAPANFAAAGIEALYRRFIQLCRVECVRKRESSSIRTNPITLKCYQRCSYTDIFKRFYIFKFLAEICTTIKNIEEFNNKKHPNSEIGSWT